MHLSLRKSLAQGRTDTLLQTAWRVKTNAVGLPWRTVTPARSPLFLFPEDKSSFAFTCSDNFCLGVYEFYHMHMCVCVCVYKE